MTKTERIKALLKKMHVKETPEILAAYEKMPDDQITVLETAEVTPPVVTAAAAQTVPTKADRVKAILKKQNIKESPAVFAAYVAMVDEHLSALEAAEPVPPVPVQLTEEQYRAQAPDSVKRILSSYEAAEAAKKTALVTKLKTAQTRHSEEKLNAMSIEQLEDMSALLKLDVPATDFSVRAAGSGGEAPKGVPAAVGLVEHITTATAASVKQ